MTARLAAAEAEVNELRARLQDLTGRLTDTQAKLATTQNQVETATARAVAAVESEQAMRQTEAERQGRGLWSRLKSAWWGAIGWHRSTVYGSLLLAWCASFPLLDFRAAVI